jgi:hypothetical protein
MFKRRIQMKYKDNKLGRYRLGVEVQKVGTVMPSKYKGYCATCHYTIWPKEKMRYNGQSHHLDCYKAIKDETPRDLHPHYIKLLGQVNKKKLKEKIG